MGFSLESWLFVFLRASGVLSVFPAFSAQAVPVQVRLALGALIAFLTAPLVPASGVLHGSLWTLAGTMLLEVTVGVMLGFASRMLFYALDIAGAIITAELGLSLPSLLDPLSQNRQGEPGIILNYLGIMLWLTWDMHHWTLIGFQKTYALLPVGGSHLRDALFNDILARTGQIFFVALQMTAPILATGFIVSLVFSILGRVVPQMNAFMESFGVRILAGLAVFGLTLNLMAQHMLNYVRRLPEDILTIAQLLGAR
ncbi:MAG: flagellar biosynthetic protein FliR [Verrucomicrobia bacterium]|nr:flagellar biosynthetic protein FliR [Verrucomicrobiota bacterium]